VSPDWGRDGTKIYYRRTGTGDSSVFERDLFSGAEREIIRRKSVGGVYLSPDGKWIATWGEDEFAKAETIIIIPVAGGESREVFRVRRPRSVGVSAWAPDSNSIIVRELVSTGGGSERWQVPLSGGEPRKLNLNLGLGNDGPLRVHPDGRQVAYSSGNDAWEVWVMENFLPAAKAAQ